MIEVIHVTKTRGDDGQDFILRQTEKNHHMSVTKARFLEDFFLNNSFVGEESNGQLPFLLLAVSLLFGKTER